MIVLCDCVLANRLMSLVDPLGLVVTNLYHLFDSDCVAGNNQEVSVILAETLKFEVAYCHNCNNDYHKTLDYLDTVAQPGLNHIELTTRSSTSSSSLRSVHLLAET